MIIIEIDTFLAEFLLVIERVSLGLILKKKYKDKLKSFESTFNVYKRIGKVYVNSFGCECVSSN